MEIFTPATEPQNGMSISSNIQRLNNQFNAGYRQTAPKGTHFNLKEYSPKWENVQGAVAGYIMDFIEDHADGRTFLWTAPGGRYGQQRFKVEDYKFSPRKGGFWEITVELTEAGA